MNPNNGIFFISIFFCNYFLMGSSLDIPNDASALLDFKSKADLNNNLNFYNTTTRHFCKWDGVSCSSSRAVKLVIESMNLGGVFGPKTLTKLSELRVLSLINNSLTGPIPDLSGLLNLKVLFLSRNYFSGSLPASISSMHRLKTLDLSYNKLSGSIPDDLNRLDRLYYLRLDFNRFNGSVPPFNFSTLQIFNISHNDLTGAIPVTPTLSRLKMSSFALNPGLCGEVIHKECHSTRPFFNAAMAPSPPAVALSQTTELGRGVELNRRGMTQKHKKLALIVGFSFGVSFFVITLVCFALLMGRRRKRSPEGNVSKMPLGGNAETVMRIEEENNELEEKVKSVQLGKQQVQQQQQLHIVGKSGSLMFCAGEVQVYTLDQLMRASAELLGRGTMGTTYKAVLDSRLIVTVKRLDGVRLASVSNEVFEKHMESVGGLRHPTLVPLRAYLQAKEERLLVYDYLANGSLFSLVHGSKSTRAKPLHWTSCLKIAEDIAQGLSYIHQAWRLVHGNLKSTNILLGSEFEACLTDYCLVALAGPTSEEDENTIAYTAPEIRKTGLQEANSMCDVYSFGILLLEILSGKFPSQLPSFGSDDDMVKWVRSVRDEDGKENRSGMLLEVAMACSTALPDQRPTMWQVLKMIQEIKEVVLTEDGELVPDSPSL